MQTMELLAPCHFGLESVLKNEIYDLGYEITEVSDGRVSFAGDAEGLVRANICLRSAERILLKVGSFTARSFEELYQGTLAIAWEDILPRDARFWVTKASSVRSALFSPSDIQSVMKKAMVDRMKRHYGLERFPETGASYPIRVFILKDTVTVALDTTGESLHKRGYRTAGVAAPIAENLAAGLLQLTPWKSDRILVDPFCGSGTIPIEAAMIAAGIAPGARRSFNAQQWPDLVPASLWQEVREEVIEAEDRSVRPDLQGYDIDPRAIEAARANAKAAGVSEMIHFQVRPVEQLSHPKAYGFILTNPPYGRRISADRGVGSAPARNQTLIYGDGGEDAMDPQAIFDLYKSLGERYKALDRWSLYLSTSYEDCEKALGLKAAKNRKIYNGMLRTYFYQFPGPRPTGGRSARPGEHT